MGFFAFLLTILYLIWLNSLIRYAVKTADRIAAATESSAAHLEWLTHYVHKRESERLAFETAEEVLRTRSRAA